MIVFFCIYSRCWFDVTIRFVYLTSSSIFQYYIHLGIDVKNSNCYWFCMLSLCWWLFITRLVGALYLVVFHGLAVGLDYVELATDWIFYIFNHHDCLVPMVCNDFIPGKGDFHILIDFHMFWQQIEIVS